MSRLPGSKGQTFNVMLNILLETKSKLNSSQATKSIKADRVRTMIGIVKHKLCLWQNLNFLHWCLQNWSIKLLCIQCLHVLCIIITPHVLTTYDCSNG